MPVGVHSGRGGFENLTEREQELRAAAQADEMVLEALVHPNSSETDKTQCLSNNGFSDLPVAPETPAELVEKTGLYFVE